MGQSNFSFVTISKGNYKPVTKSHGTMSTINHLRGKRQSAQRHFHPLISPACCSGICAQLNLALALWLLGCHRERAKTCCRLIIGLIYQVKMSGSKCWNRNCVPQRTILPTYIKSCSLCPHFSGHVSWCVPALLTHFKEGGTFQRLLGMEIGKCSIAGGVIFNLPLTFLSSLRSQNGSSLGEIELLHCSWWLHIDRCLAGMYWHLQNMMIHIESLYVNRFSFPYRKHNVHTF